MNRNAGMSQNWFRANSDEVRHARDQWGGFGILAGEVAPWDDAVLWPNSRGMGTGAQVSYIGGGSETPRWGAMPEQSGSQSMRRFMGITRDSAGAVLGSSVVQGFLTANDQYLREVVSDAGGWFDLPSEFVSVNHYLVAYKAGSPDVAVRKP